MAVRFDASGDDLRRTASLPAWNLFTIMGWFQIVTDRNAYSTFLALDDSGGNEGMLQTASDGTTLIIYNGGDSSQTYALSVGVWYHLCMTGDGTNRRAYVDGVLRITDAYTSFTPANVMIGNDIIGEWLNGRAACIKAWDAVLTQAEIDQERFTIRPVRFANLHLWDSTYPGSGERARDYSGNGRNFTETGTLTDEDPPPISWGAMPYLVNVPAAAPAAYNVIVNVFG